MVKLKPTSADKEIKSCLDSDQNFSVIAGAGSGKTTSLVIALKSLRDMNGERLRRDGQKIVCITYTNRAVDVISSRLDWDDLFVISTLHGFLWEQVKRFGADVREGIRNHIIPKRIEKKQEDDNGGNSKKATSAREKISSLEADLLVLDSVPDFTYSKTNFSDYPKGQLDHDDVVNVSAYLISQNEILRKIIGQKYPYIFVDEAQDTFENVVLALNSVCADDGLPLIGYFGDPLQQIYDKRAGGFAGPNGARTITKKENFRSSSAVIDLLNSFRTDVEQYPAGDNANLQGSVELKLVRAEQLEGKRKRYTEDQSIRAAQRFEEALDIWKGKDKEEDVKYLFLAHQMIARRLGFSSLHNLFTGTFASANAQERYQEGTHFLLKPFIDSLWPLVKAYQDSDMSAALNTLRHSSPAFDHRGINKKEPLAKMIKKARLLVRKLSRMWGQSSVGEILLCCRENGVCQMSDRLLEHLSRSPKDVEYDSALHAEDKGDWLADMFLKMPAKEIALYTTFVKENTPFSTQHGVKGEQYRRVVVVFDDIEAAWSKYSFIKTLTPETSGDPTEGQLERSRRLAYVCFSRTIEDLRILLFTSNPEAAKAELMRHGLFKEGQISISG